MRKSKVFVIQYQSRFSYGAAETFGDVRFMLTEKDEIRVNPAPNLLNEEIIAKMEECLIHEEYSPGHDYILLSGSPIAFIMVGMLLPDFGEVHQILKFDNRDFVYKVSTLMWDFTKPNSKSFMEKLHEHRKDT